jgi:Transcriptional regulators
MDKREETIIGLREVFDKIAWLNKDQMAEALSGYTPSEVHCIEAIGNLSNPNTTKIAQNVYMTKGAVSKLTKKLIKKNLIESYQKDSNKKEVYFRLTADGQKIYDIHEDLHNSFRKRDAIVFEGVRDEDYDRMLDFIARYNKHLDKEIRENELNIK